MRLAITGTTGRVGRALANRLTGRHEIVELPKVVLDLDSSDPAVALADLEFDALIHPAGMTSLEACEDDPDTARRVNADAPAALARFCTERGKRMLAFSTDYVFDGREPGLRTESDDPAPLSAYGRTKRDGELGVLDAGGTVVRVSWIFGPEKPAFPDQVLSDALAGRPLSAIADKFSLPTFTADLAGWIDTLLYRGCPPEIFHACNSGEPVSWHDIAREVVRFLHDTGRLPAMPEIKALRLDETPFFRAPRPRHTALAAGKLADLLGHDPRNWKEALREHLAGRISR